MGPSCKSEVGSTAKLEGAKAILKVAWQKCERSEVLFAQNVKGLG